MGSGRVGLGLKFVGGCVVLGMDLLMGLGDEGSQSAGLLAMLKMDIMGFEFVSIIEDVHRSTQNEWR